MSLLAEYEAWRDSRADLSAEGDSDGWAESDDAGCDLARRFAEAYTEALRAASDVVGYACDADLAAAVRHMAYRLGLDTESSSSRQHWIDTGRYLQVGEAIEAS